MDRSLMILGYNTNGFAHHRLSDAVAILAELGYGGIALTLDVHHLDPHSQLWTDSLERFGRLLKDHRMTCVIETGARFLLNPRRKHKPTLIDPDVVDRKKRFAFLAHCVEIAATLKADCVSFWSGSATSNESPDVLKTRLVEECQRLADFAASQNVRLAFEPEPGMLIDTMPMFRELFDRVNHPSFGLTLDIGHLVCMGETPIGAIIREWKDHLWNIHLDDMKRGVHDHLLFGEGDVKFDELFMALREIGYSGMASVELSRHSHDAVNTAKKSMSFLSRYQ